MDLADALRILLPVANNWQTIGILMRVPPGVLENIRTREREEPINCLRAMLEKLLTLTIHQTTWKALAEAVEPINPAKAKEIREKDVGESHDQQSRSSVESNSTVTGGPDSEVESQHPTKSKVDCAAGQKRELDDQPSHQGSHSLAKKPRLAAMPSIVQKIKGRPGTSGFAVIISNDYSSTPGLETLTGTRKDAQNMDAALQSLNVVTHCEHNVSKSRLMQLLREAAQCKDYPRDSKCIIFIFSGHGLDSNQVYMQDGSLVKINDVFQQFLPTRAPTIANIPKLFFIDACHGDREMQGVTVPRGVELRDRGGNDATLHVPPEGNFLVAYSTMPYYQAYERKGQGGIWMSILAHKITSSSRSIENILTEVNDELIDLYQSSEWKDTKMQQPEKISRLNKIVYLGGGGGATASSSKKRADGQANIHFIFP